MRKLIQTDSAPAAIGPYSQAVAAGGFLFCSGQIPIDPETGEMKDGSVKEATEQVLCNLRAVIEAAGASLSDVAKVTIYLANMDDFSAVNEVYARFFDNEPPARACVEVGRLPKSSRVEMDAVALLPA